MSLWTRFQKAMWTTGCGLSLATLLSSQAMAQAPISYTPGPDGYFNGPSTYYPPQAAMQQGASYPEYCPPGGGMGPSYSGPNGVVPSNYERLGYYDDVEHQPLVDDLILTMWRNTWIRMDYLHWNVSGPGGSPVGAAVPGVDDISQPFYVVDAGGGALGDSPFVSTNLAINQNDPLAPFGVFQAVAQTFNTNSFDLSNNNGFRGTVGLDTSFGGLEADVFVLHQAKDQFNSADTIPSLTQLLRDNNGDVVLDANDAVQYVNVPNVYVRPLSVNGVPSQNNILYYTNYQAEYDSQVWGSTSALVWDVRERDLGWNMAALFGAKYLNVRENMTQRGQYVQTGNALNFVNSSIDSTAQNHVIAPQLGWRSEFRHQYFTLGVDPRLGLGFNRWDARVATNDVVSDPTVGFNDVDQTTKEHDYKFTPTFDLRAYAEVHVRDHLTLTVAYDFMWINKIVRADEIVRYDLGSPSATVPSGIVAQSAFQSMRVDGLSLGAVIDW